MFRRPTFHRCRLPPSMHSRRLLVCCRLFVVGIAAAWPPTLCAVECAAIVCGESGRGALCRVVVALCACVAGATQGLHSIACGAWCSVQLGIGADASQSGVGARHGDAIGDETLICSHSCSQAVTCWCHALCVSGVPRRTARSSKSGRSTGPINFLLLLSASCSSKTAVTGQMRNIAR